MYTPFGTSFSVQLLRLALFNVARCRNRSFPTRDKETDQFPKRRALKSQDGLQSNNSQVYNLELFSILFT
jgi:hypothetical protein